MIHVTNKTLALLESRRVGPQIVVVDRDGHQLSFNGRASWSSKGTAMRSINADSTFLYFNSPQFTHGMHGDEYTRIREECIKELFDDGHLSIVERP